MGNELRIACSNIFAEKLKMLSVKPKRKNRKPKFYSSLEWQSAKTRVYIRDGRKCVRCFGIDNLNIDHIVPRSKVPALELDDLNLRVLCWPCNSAKNARVEIDYPL